MLYIPSQDFRQRNCSLIQPFFFASDRQMLRVLLLLSLQFPDRRLLLQVRPLLQELLQQFLLNQKGHLQQALPQLKRLPSAGHLSAE